MSPQIIEIANLGHISAGAGLGLSAVGAGIGVGLIVSSAISAMARQPEQAAKVQTVMFIGIAIIEGVALFAAVMCFLALK